MRHNFRELKIWKNAMSISRNVYELSSTLPKSERFGLSNQMNRCSVSIASNIAEGSGRTTSKDFSRFLDISISSSFELETQLILSKEIYQSNIDTTVKEINELQKMIRGFQKTLV
jgi:four helix bundle protein